MEKKLNLNKSISFYLLIGLCIIALQCVRATFTSKKVTHIKRVQTVPEEMRKAYSEKSVHTYEQAAQAHMDVASFIEADLKRQEEALWQEIETQTGISKDEVFELKEDCKKFYYEKHETLGNISSKLSEKSVTLAQEAITDFNVDPKKIALEPGRNTLLCADTMTINEREHLSMPPIVAKAIVGHEMIHYLLDDCFVLQALQLIMKDENISLSSCGYNHSYNKLRRFQELRADILPALKNMDYALASVDGLKILLRDYGDGGYVTHPKTSFRLKEVKVVYDALRLEEKLNSVSST